MDSNKPFRVTLAWTDAPGSTTANAYVNNLDLVVTIGGVTYKGNVFTNAYSIAGGTADLKNNVESVFLPAGVSGNFTVTINGTAINGIGVPNPNNALQQDFAFVIYNGSTAEKPVISPGTPTLVGETCYLTNNAIDPGETVTVNFPLQNAGGSTSTLIATLQPTGGVLAPSAPQSYGAVPKAGTVSRAFTFNAAGACGDTIIATLSLRDVGAPPDSTNLGSVSFNLPLGKLNSGAIILTQNFDSVSAPTLPVGWSTSATGAQSNWQTSASARDTIPNAAFVPDPVGAGIATLLSPLSQSSRPTLN